MNLYQWWRRWRDSKDVETRLDALRMLLHLSRNEPIKAPVLEFKLPTHRGSSGQIASGHETIDANRSVRDSSWRMEW